MEIEILETIETETRTFHPGEVIDVSEIVAKALAGRVRPLPGNNPSLEPEWQYDFCTAHAEFNHWRGSCPCSLDDCLFSKLIDTGEDLDKMRGFEIGQGITTDEVIDEWLRSNEPAAGLINQPAWFVCMAEYLVNGTEDDKENAI